MYNFKQNLNENEQILYEGRPVPGTGSKNVSGLLFIILFILIIQILMVLSVIFKLGDGAYGIDSGFIIIFGVTLFFDWIAIRGLYYNLFKKKRQ